MTETITVSQTSFNGKLQQPQLNTQEQHLPVSYNSVPKPYNQVTPFTSMTSPYLNTSHTSHGRKINFQNCPTEDNEISIFDAQKYFNEGSEQLPNNIIQIQHSSVNATDQYDEFPRLSSVSSTTDTYNARNYRGKSFHATPTASSEASWNSQTGLLSNPPGTIKVSLNPVVNKRKSHNPRWFFRRNCPCIGKKSIQVDNKTVPSAVRSPIHFQSATPANISKQADEEASTEKSLTENQNSETTSTITTISTPSIHRIALEKGSFIPSQQPPLRISFTAGRNYSDESGFSFPILKPSISSTNNKAEDPPRDSLEIFLPPNHEFIGPTRMTPNLIDDDDDAASDGSSDLFEIESFSTQTTTYQMYNNNNNSLRRDSLDEASTFRNPTRLSIITSSTNNYRRNSLEEPATPSVAPMEGYEPSEASIDWSVTTAEGFDRASVTTCEGMMMTMMSAAERDDGGGGRNNGTSTKGNGLLGLGCRSDKAVMVGPGPRRVGPTSVPVPQHVGDWVYNKPPLAVRPNRDNRG